MEEYMLRIHEAVAVIRHTHPDHVSDQGKNLQRDRFYHGLLPSLCDVLSFTMADFPKRDQVNTSFNTLFQHPVYPCKEAGGEAASALSEKWFWVHRPLQG